MNILQKLVAFFVVRNLHRAAQADLLDKTRTLLARGHDANGLDKNGVTPLFWTAFGRNLDVAKLLVQHGADINHVGPHGTTPLYNALHKRNASLALWLLAQGADAHAVTDQGLAPIHLACLNNMDTVLSRLLELGADANALTAQGQSPLCMSIIGLGLLPSGLSPYPCILRLLEAGVETENIPGLESSFTENMTRLFQQGKISREALEEIAEYSGDLVLFEFSSSRLVRHEPEQGASSETVSEPNEKESTDFGESLFGSSLHPQDDAALRAIRDGFEFPPRDWPEEKPTDQWGRLEFEIIDGKKRVVEIELVAGGKLAPEIGQLTYLRKLSTWCADIEGPLPENIGMLAHLRKLKLTDLPRLGEHLPNGITRLTSLESIELRGLPITSLPENIGVLKNLSELNLWNCPITALPESLGQATNLREIWLLGCPISALPDSLGDLPHFYRLSVSGGKLAEIPPCVARMEKLYDLTLINCNISGPIPDFIFKPKLMCLNLADNALSGAIPESICKSPLTSLLLGGNQLSGPIPTCVGKMELHSVDYSGNNLTMDEATARQTERVQFYTEHPFLRYREQPEEDDSEVDGPQMRLYGVPKPFRIQEGYGEWSSRERRSTFWGELQQFFFVLDTPVDVSAKKLKTLLPKLTPQMDEAMRKAEAVPMSALHASITEYIYDVIREEVDANNQEREADDQLWLPPRERFGEVLWPTIILPRFTLNEDGTLGHEIAVSFNTYEYYIGHVWIYAYIVDGKLIRVDQP